jgi:lipoyl(octanoyl) transferase
MDYKEALDIQEGLMAKCRNDEACDTLLLVEHPPVLTLGRSGKPSNILVSKEFLDSNGVKVYEVSRGGDVTYHGPGQIVGYPVLNLGHYGKDIREFVSRIQEAIISLLKNEFNIEARKDEKKYTGVWVDNDKITAIGISVKHWITMHGFAFNVNTDLEHFKWINPCGITDKGVTSLKKITGHEMDFDRVNDLVADYFCKAFEALPEWGSLER